MQHLGWRFTRKPSARSTGPRSNHPCNAWPSIAEMLCCAAATGPESFVAMIVRVVERSGAVQIGQVHWCPRLPS